MDNMGSNMMGFDRGQGNRFSPFPTEPQTNNLKGFNSDNTEMPSNDKESDLTTERQTTPNISPNISSTWKNESSKYVGMATKLPVLITCIVLLILGIVFANKKTF